MCVAARNCKEAIKSLFSLLTDCPGQETDCPIKRPTVRPLQLPVRCKYLECISYTHGEYCYSLCCLKLRHHSNKGRW